MIKNRAFTYVELMVVVTIIAILAAIAVPNFLEAQVRAKVSRAKADLTALVIAAEAYRLDARAWPLNPQPGAPAPWDLTVLTTPVPYIVSLPLDVMTLPDRHGQQPAGAPLPIPYRFFNALQVNPEAGLKIVNINSDEENRQWNIYHDAQIRRARIWQKKAEQNQEKRSPKEEQNRTNSPSKAEQKSKVFINNDVLGGGYIAGMFWGYGPDVVRPDNTKPLATQILKQGEVKILTYDPSNGTTSFGDIYQRVP